ncbi:MAG: OmpH family outer membrane protein [Prevotella sp.]|nr:OmpH family outer membrane protein [Prevotella sp.]
MKKTFIMALTAIALASCNNQAPKVDEKPASQNAPAELKIAFVEVDSIMTQYTYCKEKSAELEKKGNNIQKTLAQKQQALQNAAVKFQQDIQANKYTQQQAEAVQAGLQKQNNDLQVLNQRLSSEFQQETEKFNQELRKNIQQYLAEYNKDKKYSVIFSKQGDNILYADKAYDITNEVVAGLNKAYKAPKKADKDEKAVKDEKADKDEKAKKQ